MEQTHLYHIGKMIRTIREYRGLTQHDLSQAIGISRTYLANVEAGKMNPTINFIVRVCQALNCTVDIVIKPIT